MKRQLKQRKGETLGEWCERIAPLCTGLSAKEIHEVLHQVSVSSYATGSNRAIGIMRTDDPLTVVNTKPDFNGIGLKPERPRSKP